MIELVLAVGLVEDIVSCDFLSDDDFFLLFRSEGFLYQISFVFVVF